MKMTEFLEQYSNPTFVSNKEMDRHERDQDMFVEALCIEEYLRIIDYRDDGVMVTLTSRGRTAVV